MATSVSKPHVVVTEKDSEEEDMCDNQEGSEDEGSSDGGDEEGSGEDSLDGGVDDDESGEDSVDGDVGDEASGEESADGDDEEKGPGEDSADGGDEEAEDENEENPNAGWAEAMAKILRKKTPEDKSCILLKSKQKKLNETERKERLEKKKKADKKRSWEMMCRVKPDVVQDREKEKNLQRTATRGVVQLFNAVRQHQKKVDEKVKEVGGSERKKAKVLSSISKKDFIDVLKGSAGCTTPTATSAKPEKEEKPAWSVLRDDFMMGSSMKDWDKGSDAEPGRDDPEPTADLDSDSD